MNKAYLLPGLGADYRIYQYIAIPGYEIVHISWLAPDKHDTLASFARKLIEAYQIEPNSVVIGNSLGGMLAIEIGKQQEMDKVILISSIKTVSEAPVSFKWHRYIPLYKLLPARLITSLGFFVRFAFGTMSKEHQELFISMLKHTPPTFAKWAIGAILHWDNQVIPKNVYHITGDKDKIFPCKRIQGATILEGGTHIMIFNKAKQINSWLKEIL